MSDEVIQAGHECWRLFEANRDTEFLSESVLVRGECGKCGRDLTEVYDLAQVVATENSETVKQFSGENLQ